MTLKIPRTGFHVLKLDFPDLLMEIRDKDQRSLPSRYMSKGFSVQAKVLVFHDLSKLHCIEKVDIATQEIEEYWYDWENTQGEVIMKFHGHYHEPGTPPEITQFDPFHIHKKLNPQDYKASHRELNHQYRTVRDVLCFIRNAMYAKSYL
jgi:Family of unknown function (DUF6516)